MNDKTYDYEFNLDKGRVRIYIPTEITTADVEDLEAHFALVIKQCKRRTSTEPTQ